MNLPYAIIPHDLISLIGNMTDQTNAFRIIITIIMIHIHLLRGVYVENDDVESNQNIFIILDCRWFCPWKSEYTEIIKTHIQKED